MRRAIFALIVPIVSSTLPILSKWFEGSSFQGSIRELTPVIGGVLIFAHSSRSNSWNLARNRVRTERFFPLERFAEEASLPMRLESGRKVGPRLSGRYNRDI